MSLNKTQQDVGLVVEAMVDLARTLPNRKHDPLKILPSGLLRTLAVRMKCAEFLGANARRGGPAAMRFSALLAQAEGELSRRGIHAVSLRRGAEPGLDYHAEGIRPGSLRVWRDEEIVTGIIGAVQRPAQSAAHPANRAEAQQPAPGERLPLSAAVARRPMRRTRTENA